MTAPARTRTRSRSQSATRTRQRARASVTTAPEAPEVVGSPKRRSSAAERAYARRAQRAQELRQEAVREPQAQGLKLRLRWPRSRASFVLLLMALMVAGVATTLWLSTQAIADSYRLEELRQNNAQLAENSEQLQRDVSSAESPGSLADRAKALGMVPGGNPARIVVNPDGSLRVVGEPTEATEPAPPPAPEQPEPPAPADGEQAQGEQAQGREQGEAPAGQNESQDGAQGENQGQDPQAGDAAEGRSQEEQAATEGD
ncbi:septum formation initiator [Prauserella cavernicola]|uniref:Septum formation initiator n=1 Tax=Prauserella cavernicola TaxID=2800127 RepID=A0A934QY28_9PSEU|nr:septum formation initiator [Prauserella cavernicola]MBK1788626.1 septum formation initiator [Prauserella cavernicola]